ncbi:MAG: FKBP-type peptidyl-prolyl cis-trans isomerase [Bacteroidales bacterium]|nr:FKBP-type peptidyl-prolyl cis-trans isomerase [Bacteroidales bacterium]
MRKVFFTFIVATIVLLSASCERQNPPASSKLTNLKDSASYAMGIILAQQYLDEQMDTLMNRDLTLNGITDLMKNDTSLLSHDEAVDAISAYSRQIIDIKYGSIKKEGEDFLAKNITNTGIMQTTSGLQYKVLEEGDGSAHPSVSDNVVIKFEGRKIDGTLFGSTGDTPSENNLMSLPRGLAEGILLMTPKAKYKFFIPYYLAFGETGYQTVEPYSTVIFDVELLEIVKK